MKCSSPRILFMALLSHLTLATAQEFGRNGNLLLRETWTGPVSGSVTYTFGNDLDVTSRRVNARTAVAFSYDADRFLTGVGDLTITRHPQNALVTGTAISAVTMSSLASGSWSGSSPKKFCVPSLMSSG